MPQTIHADTAITNYKTFSPVTRGFRIAASNTRTNTANAAKPETAAKLMAELTEKLNELAKRRPFNILCRVKKYDPL